MSAAMFMARRAIASASLPAVDHGSRRCERIIPPEQSRYRAAAVRLRFQHVAGTRQNKSHVLVRDNHHRFEAAQ